MINIEICVATKDDYKALYELQLVAYGTEDTLYEYTIPPLLQSADEAFVDCERSLVLKALHKGNIIGSIRGYEKNKICYIHKLMVNPTFRNNGIGTTLLLEIEKRFSTRTYELFTGTKSLTNIALYKRNGYKVFHIDTDNEMVFMRKLSNIDA